MLDDLHWADKPSLLLLQFLARELRDARFLVLGGYRDVELGRQHPLSHTLAELTREQLSQRVVLRGLSEPDVARFIEMTAGIDPPGGLVTTVFKETEGNPFFVKEVVSLLASERRLGDAGAAASWTVAIPESVREVVGRRLDQLSEECNKVLTVASVAGREFDLKVLERVTGIEGDGLLDAVEEALAARVVTEVPRTPDRYSFSHALIRETLYEELTATRRFRLHRQIGDALEQLYGAKPEAHLAELAYHFCEAARGGGDVDKAIEYARRAGARAMSVYAWEEAAGHYQHAMEALDLKVEPDEAMRCELLLALAETEWNAGEFEKSREDSLRAATVAREHGAPEQLARAAVGYGGSAAADGTGLTDQGWISILQEVLDTLEEGHDALRARAMTKLAEAQIFSGPYNDRAALCQRALELARKANDPIVLGDVLASIHWTLWSPDNVNERLDMANEIQQLAEETGSVAMAAVATQWRSIDLVELGDVRVAKQNLEIIAPRVQEARMAYDLWAVRVYQATLLISEGRLEEGERAAGRALEIGQRRQNPNALALFGVQLLLLRREQGRFQELEPVMSTYVEQYPAIPAWRCGLAWLYSNIGQEPEARAEFERLAVDDFARLPRDMFWVTGLALLANVCGYLRDSPRAGILYDLLALYADRCAIPIAVIFGAVARSLGVLATTIQRWEDAVRHFENAIEMNERLGSPPWVAHTRYDYAKMLLARGAPSDREQALALLDAALTTARELGMKSLVERALALKLKLQGVDVHDVRSSLASVAETVQAERPDISQHAAPDGTVTLLFTDIDGSTAMNERLGDSRWMELLREHNASVTSKVSEHGGTVVKLIGDGFMIAFRNARRALECACAVQAALAEHHATADEKMLVRIGVHTGDLLRTEVNFYGNTVNAAAGIAEAARGGEILVSSLVKELSQASAQVVFEFQNGRQLDLNGIPAPVTVYTVSWGED